MQDFLGIYLKEMGGGESLVGLVTGLATVSELPILFMGAALINRWGPWRLLMAAYSMAVLRFLLYGLIPTPEWALPVSLLHSFTFGVFWIGGVAYVNNLAPVGMKATGQGFFYATLNLSRVLAAPVNGYLFDTLGPAVLFRVGALIGLVALGVLWIGKPKVVSLQKVAT